MSITINFPSNKNCSYSIKFEGTISIKPICENEPYIAPQDVVTHIENPCIENEVSEISSKRNNVPGKKDLEKLSLNMSASRKCARNPQSSGYPQNGGIAEDFCLKIPPDIIPYNLPWNHQST